MSFSAVKRKLFWLDDFIHGGEVKRFYDELGHINSDYASGYPMQQEHLRNILEHAAKYSAFFSKNTYRGGGLVLSL